MKVVTRIAPSPTGYLHFGLARTALFNYLYARQAGGKYIMRIEDTDRARNKQEFDDDIHEQLEWLHLTPDQSYRQSEHINRHRECLSDLIARDLAYVSKEPRKDDPSQIVEVVRLRNPGSQITFTDLIRGDISFDTTELKDFVIARSINEPIFHFAVVIDDHDEHVTHVIRGDDHISNTPRQILIQRALGFEVPAYAHLPLILMPDKSKMSKRKHETSVRSYREKGILPEALINYVALLGWTPPSGKEFLSLEELTQEFRLEDLHKSGAIFDIEKLRWFNRHYLHELSDDDFKAQSVAYLSPALEARGVRVDDDIARLLVPVLRERVSVWEDITILAADGDFDYFFTDPVIEVANIPDKKSDSGETLAHLEHAHQIIEAQEPFTYDAIKAALWDYATEKGRGAVLWPLRYALSGRQKSPDPFIIASIIGKEATLRRINAAIGLLRSGR